MTDKVESFTHEGKTVTLYRDDMCGDPRDGDGHFLWLGLDGRNVDGDALMQWITAEHKALLVVPVGMIDHSGVSFYLGGGSHWSDSAGWDSGTCGFMVFTEQMSADWGLTDLDEARKQMGNELDEYNSWCAGDCYGYVVTEPNVCPTCQHNDPIEGDSCWGFVGYEWAMAEARAAVGLPANYPE